MTRAPDSLAVRVARSQAKRLATGARLTPRGILPPDASRALDALHERGYADSLTGCIARALCEADKRK